MKIEFRATEPDRQYGRIENVYKSHQKLLGRFIFELDVAAVQITSIKQLDDLIDALHTIRPCFMHPRAKQIEGAFDSYEDVQDLQLPGEQKKLTD